MTLSGRGRVIAAAALALAVALLLLPASAGAATRHLGAGTATFSLDPAETNTFMSNVIAPSPVYPARLSFGHSTVTFKMPISGGTWSGEKGTFLLTGGLAYVSPTAPSTFKLLRLTQWHAGVNTLAGFSIVANGTRSSPFFDENLMGSIPSIVKIHGHKYVKVTNVMLFLNTTSAAALTTAFGAPSFNGDFFGSVTLLARVK